MGYLGVQLWLNRGKMALSNTAYPTSISATSLAFQGFITAIANPKGWAFFIALLPPFINQTKPLIAQISVLLAIILTLACICLIIYAGGGNTLRKFLQKGDNVRLMNRIAGTLMLGVGVWLAFGQAFTCLKSLHVKAKRGLFDVILVVDFLVKFSFTFRNKHRCHGITRNVNRCSCHI